MAAQGGLVTEAVMQQAVAAAVERFGTQYNTFSADIERRFKAHEDVITEQYNEVRRQKEVQ